MIMPLSLILLLALATLAVVIEPHIRRQPLPFTAILVLIGFLGSEALVWAGFDTGLRWYGFKDLVLHILLPVLVFESAFHIPIKALQRNFIAIFILAVPAVIISAFISAFILFYLVDHPDSFPFLTALLAGIILTATDPVAVVAMFKSAGASQRLTILVEGESLFNDATAVVFYTLLILALTSSDSGMQGPAQAVPLFFSDLGSGIISGALFGYAGGYLYRKTDSAIGRAVISLFCACSSFYLAEPILQGSGIVAVLITGLYLGHIHREYRCQSFTSQLWQLNGYIANVIVFLLMGVTITLEMFAEQWLAMLCGIGAATFARALVIYTLCPITGLIPGQAKIPLSYQHVMMWGGLRGGVGIALVLALPTLVPSWYTVQAIVYGIVLFTLFIQAPLMPELIRKTL
jgi:CPA1 family monovalent cation:H+ antiporter